MPQKIATGKPKDEHNSEAVFYNFERYFYSQPIVSNFIKIYDVIDLEATYSLVNLSDITKIEIEHIKPECFLINAIIGESSKSIFGVRELGTIKDAHAALEMLCSFIENSKQKD